MAKIEKYQRKSGVTTVAKDGKIIGNIGTGKNNVPTSHADKRSLASKREEKITSIIIEKTEIFQTLEKTPTDDNLASEKINEENLTILWEITQGQEIKERMTMLMNLMNEDNKTVIYDFYHNHIDVYEGNLETTLVNHSALRLLAFQDTSSPQLLNLLATSKDEDIRVCVADNKNTPLETLATLSKDDNYRVRKAIAGNANTTEDMLLRLCREDKNSEVLQELARSPRMPVEGLRMLAESEESEVRQNLAINQNTPGDILAMFVYDDNSKVMWGISTHDNVTPETLRELLNVDIRPYARRKNVLKAIAKNPNAPVDVLFELEKNENSLVSENASVNLRARQLLGEN